MVRNRTEPMSDGLKGKDEDTSPIPRLSTCVTIKVTGEKPGTSTLM